ncbi:MAG: integrin alpha [Pseudomonadota bacterium]
MALLGATCQVAGAIVPAALAQTEQPSIDLATLPSDAGTRLLGQSTEEEFFGYSVAAVGDVNGDGIDDIAVGAVGSDRDGEESVGRVYVVLGRQDLADGSDIELEGLDSPLGFVFEGVQTNDLVGGALSGVGDLNGDGFDDVAIGAFFADSEVGAENDTGQVYVVFGQGEPFPSEPLTKLDLDGANGFTAKGPFPDGITAAVAGAEDVNGDGYDDLVIGTTDAYPADVPSAGQGYIVFGSPSVGASGSVDLVSLRGSSGAVINGVEPFADLGRSVGGGGDVNGDGLGDAVFGAFGAAPGGVTLAGQVHVVLGRREPFPQRLEVSELNGSNGFTYECTKQGARCGISVDVLGDLNADGFDDIVFSGPGANVEGRVDAGQTYVVFGGADVGGDGTLSTDDLVAAVGVIINGAGEGDSSGLQVSSSGDWNGDGIADLVIGAAGASPLGRASAGAVYLLFGSPTFGSEGALNLADITPWEGHIILGATAGESAGFSTTGAGDFNGDGADDLLIGAYNASPGGVSRAGIAYVLWGQPDADGDGIVDPLDNCRDLENADQRDSNADGFGNVCDADLNDDCVVNIRDWLLMRNVLGTSDADADIDGDGVVTVADARVLFQNRLSPPGPSGITDRCETTYSDRIDAIPQ